MKRVLCLVLVLTMICALLTFMPVTAATYGNLNYEDGTYGYLGYKKYMDHIEINYCSESAVSVDIPNEIDNLPVTRIGDDRYRAFAGCMKLTSITIPPNITSIDNGSFTGCGKLNITVSADNEVYSSIDGVLFNKDKTEILYYAKDIIQPEYSIPESVTTIGECAFLECKNLTKITIPNSINNIKGQAFESCEGLKNIDIPESVKTIGNGAFSLCINLSNVIVPDSVTSIADFTFSGCKNMSNISMGNSVKTFGAYSFEGCDSLLTITIPKSVETIMTGAFHSCSQLRHVTLYDGLRNIEGQAFWECVNLTSIELPNSIKHISGQAFWDCKNLNTIYIPNSVTEIINGAFWGCEKLKDIYYGGSKDEWNSINIMSGNDELLNATIHYNSPMPGGATPTPKPTPTQKPTPIPTQRPTPIPTAKPTADPNAPSVEITEVSDYIVTAKVNNCNDFDAQVILAVYNKNGALIEMQKYYNFGDVTFFSANLQNANIKVMLWSGTDNIKPLAETAEMSL